MPTNSDYTNAENAVNYIIASFLRCKETGNYQEVADTAYFYIKSKQEQEQLAIIESTIKYVDKNFSLTMKAPGFIRILCRGCPGFIKDFINLYSLRTGNNKKLGINKRAELLLVIILTNSAQALTDLQNSEKLKNTAKDEFSATTAEKPIHNLKEADADTKQELAIEQNSGSEIIENTLAATPVIINSSQEALQIYNDTLFELYLYTLSVIAQDIFLSTHNQDNSSQNVNPPKFYSTLSQIKNRIEVLQNAKTTNIAENNIKEAVDIITIVVDIANQIEAEYRAYKSVKSFMHESNSSMCLKILDKIFALVKYFKNTMKIISKKLYLTSESVRQENNFATTFKATSSEDLNKITNELLAYIRRILNHDFIKTINNSEDAHIGKLAILDLKKLYSEVKMSLLSKNQPLMPVQIVNLINYRQQALSANRVIIDAYTTASGKKPEQFTQQQMKIAKRMATKLSTIMNNTSKFPEIDSSETIDPFVISALNSKKHSLFIKAHNLRDKAAKPK